MAEEINFKSEKLTFLQVTVNFCGPKSQNYKLEVVLVLLNVVLCHFCHGILRSIGST